MNKIKTYYYFKKILKVNGKKWVTFVKKALSKTKKSNKASYLKHNLIDINVFLVITDS